MNKLGKAFVRLALEINLLKCAILRRPLASSLPDSYAPANAQKNVQSDAAQTDESADDYIKNLDFLPLTGGVISDGFYDPTTQTADQTPNRIEAYGTGQFFIGYEGRHVTHAFQKRGYDTRLGADAGFSSFSTRFSELSKTVIPSLFNYTNEGRTDYGNEFNLWFDMAPRSSIMKIGLGFGGPNNYDGSGSHRTNDNFATRQAFISNIRSNRIELLDESTEESSEFDFAVINEDNELKRSPIGISNIRVLTARIPSLSAMIPTSSVNAVFTGITINLGKIFANGNTIFSLTSWFDISTRNGGGNIADGSFEAPTRITQEVFLTFADTSINLANTSQNNEIALFTTEITQEEFKNDTGGGLMSMKVDMSHGIVFSSGLEFSSLIVNHQTFDPLGNLTATDSRTYRGQDSSFNSHPSFGNVLFADHEFILNRRIIFEFKDSENTNGQNGIASTTLNHQSTIVEII